VQPLISAYQAVKSVNNGLHLLPTFVSATFVSALMFAGLGLVKTLCHKSAIDRLPLPLRHQLPLTQPAQVRMHYSFTS
jgi:hypothetical protein